MRIHIRQEKDDELEALARAAISALCDQGHADVLIILRTRPGQICGKSVTITRMELVDCGKILQYIIARLEESLPQ